MVSGEYAVLEGAVAVVASVNVRAYARWSIGAASGSPARIGSSPQSAQNPAEAVLTRKLAEEAVGAVQAELAIDVNELRKSGRKLGLGSSAAAAAAAAGAVLASAGEDLGDAKVQRRAFELALAGHKAIAPEGSGADVAASSLGGFVRFRLDGEQVAEAERVAWPARVATRVVWTGKEARTSEFLRAVRAFEGRDRAGYGSIRDTLHAQAKRFADAIAGADSAEIVASAGLYGATMGELGRAAGVSIVTPELQRIADLAVNHGGAAKPSGAGGGDVAIAFFTSETDAVSFDAACLAAGLDLLDLGLGAPGVRPESP